MDRRIHHRILSLTAFLLPAALAAQQAPGMGMQHRRGMGHGPDTLPASVTAATVTEGRALFTGKAMCFTCHNVDGSGGIGPNLTDDTWLHGTGAYRQILHHVDRGFGPGMSKTGVVMPPRGGSQISDAEMAAVAAYVWTLSRPEQAP